MRANLTMCAVVVLFVAACQPQTCEDSCNDQLDECLETAPPGASRQDCFDKHRACMASCTPS